MADFVLRCCGPESTRCAGPTRLHFLNPPAGRRAAFAHLAAHELQDFEGWCERMRDSARGLYPAEARLVSSQEELRANLRDATVVTETGEQQFMNALTGAARRRPAVRIRAH